MRKSTKASFSFSLTVLALSLSSVHAKDGHGEMRAPTFYLLQRMDWSECEYGLTQGSGFRLYKHDHRSQELAKEYVPRKSKYIERAKNISAIFATTGSTAGLIWGKNGSEPTLVVFEPSTSLIRIKAVEKEEVQIRFEGLWRGESSANLESLAFIRNDGGVFKVFADGRIQALPLSFSAQGGAPKIVSDPTTDRIALLHDQVYFKGGRRQSQVVPQKNGYLLKDLILSPAYRGVIFHRHRYSNGFYSKGTEPDQNLISLSAEDSDASSVFAMQTTTQILGDKPMSADQYSLLSAMGVGEGEYPKFAQVDPHTSAIATFENGDLILYAESTRKKLQRSMVFSGIYSRNFIEGAITHREWQPLWDVSIFVEPKWLTTCAQILGSIK